MTPTRAYRRLLADRRGIAIPLVLMLIVFLTISLSAGFIIAGNEHQIGLDHDAQLRAFAVAQEGIEQYLVSTTTLPASFPDVQTLAVNGDTATVTMRQFRAAGPGYSAIYVVTSVGKAMKSMLRRSASTPIAQRTVSQFVTWQSGTINVQAAWTALNGLNKNGVSGTVTGVDQADATTSCSASGTTIAGIAVPDTSFHQNGGNTNWIGGNPANGPLYLGTPGQNGTAKTAIDLDWAGILAGSIPPDFTIKTTAPTSGTWPTTTQMNNFPVILVKGDLSGAPSVGKGILIVTGNATFGPDWHGLVLVGGTITMNGASGSITGAAYSGLNIQVGTAVPNAAVGNGNISVKYSACDVSKSLSKFGGWQRVQNSWVDNWPSYSVP